MEEQERRRTIIEYIANNPGCNKQKVVKALEGRLSRVPVLKIIEEIEQDDIVNRLTDRENSREHKLYVNNNNIVVTVSNELKEFEEAFFSSFRKVKEKFEALYLETWTQYSSDLSKCDLSKMHPIVNLISELFHIFYEVVDIYMIRSMMVWPKKIQDRDILKKLYSIIFTKIADMQLRMSDLLSTTVAGDFNPINQLSIRGKIYSTKKLMEHFDNFRNCNMEKEIEQVLNSTWRISNEYKQVVYPEPNLFKWDFNYQIDDWKKLIKLQKQHPDQTFPNLVNEQLKQGEQKIK
jgi:hypothetical protein